MIFSFYSYKGGVGRTMALANVAQLLYQRGLRVLMVDFDLEAPGLERFFKDTEALCQPDEIIKKRGVIDLLLSYKKLQSLSKYSSQDSDKEDDFLVEPITEFIVTLYKENEQRGSLSIIPSGYRYSFSAYAQNINSFNWNEFYEEWNGQLFFEWFRTEVTKLADVVLIDSRTGVTEMGGVCNYQLADVVVMFVSPNDQNLDGTLKMAQSLSNPDLIEKGRGGRELSLVIVPSRVDNGESDLLDSFQKEFEQKLGNFIPSKLEGTFKKSAFLDLKVPYVPFYAFKEKIAVRDAEKASAFDLSEAYENLAFTLAQLTPKDSLFYKSCLDKRLILKVKNLIFPSGALSLDSPLYIEREPMESECYESILGSGSVTRIMAPSQFGKTSLLNRIVDYAKNENYRVAYVNIKQVINRSTRSSLEAFLRCFCEVVDEKLGLSLNGAWQDQRTAQINCTRYFEKLLMEAETPLLLVLDGVEKLYSYDTINPEFFPMLRTWQDKVSDPNKEHWKKLRQVIAYSCPNYGKLDVSRSPFNIGRSFELEEFTEAEIFELGQRYRLRWNEDQVKQLMSLIGGHPYLVNLALYELATHPETTLEQFLENNPSNGIYGDYLRSLIEYLERDLDLISALNQVINTTEKSVRLDPKLQYKLYSIGIIEYQNFRIKIRCELYRQYFQEYLSQK